LRQLFLWLLNGGLLEWRRLVFLQDGRRVPVVIVSSLIAQLSAFDESLLEGDGMLPLALFELASEAHLKLVPSHFPRVIEMYQLGRTIW